MDKPTVTNAVTRLEDELYRRVSDTYVQLAKLLGSTPSWLPFWFEFYLMPSGQYDVRLDQSRPSRAQRLKTLKLDRDLNFRALQAAHSSCDESLINKFSLKIDRIDAEIGRISRAKGRAKPGPNKGAVPSKYLIAARLFEAWLFVKGKEPSPRNPKLAAMLVSLLDTLGILRPPIGNRLNGNRKAFELVLSASGKVNKPELRKHDALQDEIVLARLHSRRSLEQCKMRGGAPWGFPGMNGPVVVYDPKTEI
jgi:hypothetical protein